MKLMQLIVAVVISMAALASHAAFLPNMTAVQIRTEIAAQLAAQSPAGSDLNAVARSAAGAGLNMASFVTALMGMPGVTPAQAVRAAVLAQPTSAVAIAEAAAKAAPDSAATIARTAAGAAPSYADAIADAVALIVPAAANAIYAQVQIAVPAATLTPISGQVTCGASCS